MCARVHTHPHTHTHMYGHTHTRTHTNVHARAHTHTRKTYTYAHTRTNTRELFVLPNDDAQPCIGTDCFWSGDLFECHNNGKTNKVSSYLTRSYAWRAFIHTCHFDHCKTLEYTVTRNPLQRTSTHCNALQRTAMHCNPLQRIATPATQLNAL